MKSDEEKLRFRMKCVRVCVRDQLATACLCFKKRLLYSSLGCSTGTKAHIFSGVCFSSLRNNIHFPRVNIVTDMVKIIFGDYSSGFMCVCMVYMHWSEIRYLLWMRANRKKKKTKIVRWANDEDKCWFDIIHIQLNAKERPKQKENGKNRMEIWTMDWTT